MPFPEKPHEIRLIGPWELERDGEVLRAHLPRDWPGIVEERQGHSVRLRRRFHRPTGLMESTRVFVVLPREWSAVAVRLNNDELPEAAGEGPMRRFELTGLVAARESHVLEVGLTVDAAARQAPFLVALQIDERA